MFITVPLPFATDFVEELDAALRTLRPEAGLSNTQKRWLTFCILAIAVTNGVCWKWFERASLGVCSHAALSWMFRHASIPWQLLLRASVMVILRQYGITKGILVLDDTDKPRCKVTKRIYRTHKLKDKASGGYVNGQCLVMLCLVSAQVTIPVGFAFYMPDPALTAWRKTEKELKKQGVPKRERPPKPERNAAYPTKSELALQLLEAFHTHHPTVTVTCVVADALYGTQAFVDRASAQFGGIQVISQLRSNQNVRVNNKKVNLETYFAGLPAQTQRIRVRGGKTITVTVKHARLYVCAHGKKRLVVALKYEGEKEYRYLVASDLTWLARSVVQAYTFRWLVEVFIQDWKAYEGWGNLTKQPGEEGSKRSLTLSLLLDHCLLTHPAQRAQIENNLPAYTVGSLTARIKVDALLLFITDLLQADDPSPQLDYLAAQKDAIFELRASTKHMSGRKLGRLGPNPLLQYYYEHCDPTV
jgi:hypothetical protein